MEFIKILGQITVMAFAILEKKYNNSFYVCHKEVIMKFYPGDRIRYTNKNKYLNDALHSPLWGGYYGKIEGTVLAANNEEYKKKFHYQYEDGDKEFPLKIKWDNGCLNGFKPSLFECFTIVNKQLKLF